MHERDRPKRTTVFYAKVDLRPLEKECDGNHKHKPWGMIRKGSVFATAEESRYPKLLYDRLAERIKR